MSLVVKYNEARQEYKEGKQKKKEAEDNLKRLQISSAPSLEAVNSKQRYHEDIEKVVEDRKARLRAAESAAAEATAAVEAAETKCQGIASKLEAERTSNNTKRQELGALRKKLTTLEGNYKQTPQPFDAADWNRRIREQEHLARDKKTEVNDAGTEAGRLRDQGGVIGKDITKIQTEIQNLESQQGNF